MYGMVVYSDDGIEIRKRGGDDMYSVETVGLGGEQIFWNLSEKTLADTLKQLAKSCTAAIVELGL